MAVYAIGDVQGCFEQLQALLDKIAFDATHDTLWFAGDLVNRGPDSLATLRYIKALGKRAICVLGNHDLHLLAIAAGQFSAKKKDTLAAILSAPDRAELLDWLRHRPLLHHDPALGYTMLHAGLPPQWSISQCKTYAGEVEQVLQSADADSFFANMYGDEPTEWSEHLTGWSRLRYITNCLTRLRYCDQQGALALAYKGPPGSQPVQYQPWFNWPERASREAKIIFGHWSTLPPVDSSNLFAIDTGCIWGGQLSALRIDQDPATLTAYQCPQIRPPK